jgi:Flp pilus assembly protein CpaB
MTYRTRNILMASGLAVLAAVFMLIYTSKAGEDSAADVGKLVSVLVAGHDIDQGTRGSTLGDGVLVEKRVPAKARVPGAITSPGEVRGLVATQETLSGEQVSVRRFGPLAATGPLPATGVRSQIRGYARVVQLAGNPNQVLDGTLDPGDRVDVLGSWTPVSCSRCRVSSVIVRNALVLKTSGELGSGGSSSADAPVQLRLTDEEANVVFWMEEHGAWRLMLRPVLKPRNNKLSYSTVSSIVASLKRRGLIR